MLKAIQKFFRSTPSTQPLELVQVSRDQHPISRKAISDHALKVLYRLNQHHYEAYLVGGGVRDLMVGMVPKDFDVVTNATPEQVRALFRNSRIIGRRFKIVHVVFGREIIEVATFRASADPSEEATDDTHHRRSESGMLLRDNVYGTLEDDIVRRDFTINAMYYSAHDFSLTLLAQSLEDVQNKKIRMIGDPQQRYREDPVRMLRAIRFAAKLGFTIAPQTAKPIHELAPLLDDVAPGRLFDDFLKLFMSGHGVRTYELLKDFDCLRRLFPHSAKVLDHASDNTYEQLIIGALKSTDERIAKGKSVTPAFLLAALLWPLVEDLTAHHIANGEPPLPARQQAIQEAISVQGQRTSIPKRFQFTMRDIWEMQSRLPHRHGNRALRLLEHPKFRAAFDFLLLREAAGAETEQLGSWWETFQFANEHKQQQMLAELGTTKPKRRRRRAPRQTT